MTAAAIHRKAFGATGDGQPVDLWLLRDGGVQVGLIGWGATVQSLILPDRNGKPADVALGFDDIDGYLGEHPFLGAVVGRFANRIAAGRFELDGTVHQVPVNDGRNALHGGPGGFHGRWWSVDADVVDGIPAVRMQLRSPDGEMGFPGELLVDVTYGLRETELRIDYEARTDRTTVVNLSNHTYLNLAGAGSGPVESHEVQIAADFFLPVLPDGIPLGEQASVAGTPMDFRGGKAVGRDLRSSTPQLLHGRGYDHTWVLAPGGTGSPSFAVRVRDPGTGRVLEVHTDQPGVQFYSGNHLDGSLAGKGGRVYRSGDGLCLETQHFPDSPNQPSFPSTVLRPGEVFRSTTCWRFATD